MIIATVIVQISVQFPFAANAVDINRPYDRVAIDHYNNAIQLHQAGKLNEAAEEYKAAVKADDRMVEAWNNLVVIYRAQNKSAEADEAFQKVANAASEIEKDGERLNSEGKTKEAIERWQKALFLDPDLDVARKNLEAAGVPVK